MQVKKQKIIKVTPSARDKLMKMHSCSYSTIYNALAYRTNGRVPDQIRNDAIKLFGGVETEKTIVY